MIPSKPQFIYLGLISSTLLVMLSFQNCTTARTSRKSVLAKISERKMVKQQGQGRAVTLTGTKPNAKRPGLQVLKNGQGSESEEFTVTLRENSSLKPATVNREIASETP